MRMRRLGELEMLVMERMWSWGRPAAVRDVLEDLQNERALAYTTVMTVMDNLHRKAMLTREKDGRAWAYLPALSREQYIAAIMTEALASTSDRTGTLLHFMAQMPSEEAALLRQALDGRLEDRGGPAR